MATRNCSSCTKDLPKSEYSKNQWSKKDTSSKCKACVAGGNAPAPAPAAVKETDAPSPPPVVAVPEVDTKAVEEAKKAAEEKRLVDEAAAAEATRKEEEEAEKKRAEEEKAKKAAEEAAAAEAKRKEEEEAEKKRAEEEKAKKTAEEAAAAEIKLCEDALVEKATDSVAVEATGGHDCTRADDIKDDYPDEDKDSTINSKDESPLLEEQNGAKTPVVGKERTSGGENQPPYREAEDTKMAASADKDEEMEGVDIDETEISLGEAKKTEQTNETAHQADKADGESVVEGERETRSFARKIVSWICCSKRG